MNRNLLLSRLVNISPELRDELSYYLNDVEHEGKYDMVDALDDYLNLILNGNPNTEVKKILIDCGYCMPVDISKIMVSSGKKYWFIYNKQHYDCVGSWEQWINI